MIPKQPWRRRGARGVTAAPRLRDFWRGEGGGIARENNHAISRGVRERAARTLGSGARKNRKQPWRIGCCGVGPRPGTGSAFGGVGGRRCGENEDQGFVEAPLIATPSGSSRRTKAE